MLADSSSTESELDFNSELHVYHATPQKDKEDTPLSTGEWTEQSNIDEERRTINHMDVFMSCMSIYQIAGMGPEAEGFKLMDDVASGIKDYETYWASLDNKKSKLGHYH